MRLSGLLILVWMLGACAGGSAPEAPSAGSAADQELASSIHVRVSGDTVLLDLYVTNSTGSPVELEYADAQRYDFEVRTPEGERLWRWSDGRLFAQMLGREALAAGQTVHHQAAWVPGSRTGRFVAAARLTATNRRVERLTYFDLP